jgi:hypothetical protein
MPGVHARLKPTPCEFRDICQGGGGVLKHVASLSSTNFEASMRREEDATGAEQG